EHGRIEDAGQNTAALAESLNAIRDETVVVVVPQRCSRQAHWEPELVQPVGQATVDRDLVAGQSQGLQQVTGLLRSEAEEVLLNMPRHLDFDVPWYQLRQPIALDERVGPQAI